MSYSKQQVIATMHRAGYEGAAVAAATELPDEVDLDTLQAWAETYGITLDAIVSQMGGSP